MKETLNNKVWNDGEEGCHNMYYEEDVKEAIKEAYLGMPWAILTPLAKKAIEVAFKDSFGGVKK